MTKSERVGTIIGIAIRVGLIVWVTYTLLHAVGLVQSDIHHIAQVIDSRRYLDCVLSPSGDELLCKQVTVSDPPYQP